MPKVTLVHDEVYSGTDPGNGGKLVDMQPGQTTDVSAAKLEQLLTDFPDRFKKHGRGKARTPATFEELSGDELRTLAADRDVDVDDDDDDATIRAALIADDKTQD